MTGDGEVAKSLAADDEQQRRNTIFERHRLCKSSYTHFHVIVFILTFSCQMLIHASRKSLGTVKPVISQEWTPSYSNETQPAKLPNDVWNKYTFFKSVNDPHCKDFLGGLDTANMMAYATGLFFSGTIGEHYNLRYVIFIGIIGNSLTVFLFACLGEWFKLYSYYWYTPLWLLNGFFQSTALPSLLGIMGNWFGKSHRGFIFGFWGTTSSVGNIIGSVLVSGLLNYGYEKAMLVPAVLVLAMGIVVFCGLVVSPIDVGLPSPGVDQEIQEGIVTSETVNFANQDQFLQHQSSPDENEIDQEAASATQTLSKPKAIGFFEAILLPGVIIYSVTYAFIKLVHYSFFYWLPLYLNRHYLWNPAEAGDVSAWYDVGGIFGAIVGGYISDITRKRSPVLSSMLLLGIPTLLIFKSLPGEKVWISLVLVVIGIFIGGVVNIMSAAIAADLGKQPKLKSNQSALSTVTGIMDGVGSIGAAAGQILVPLIENSLGWQAVFVFFTICVVATSVCFLPILYKELLVETVRGQIILGKIRPYVSWLPCCRINTKNRE